MQVSHAVPAEEQSGLNKHRALASNAGRVHPEGVDTNAQENYPVYQCIYLL